MFAVFMYDQYYPGGGVHDVGWRCDSLAEAIAWAQARMNTKHRTDYCEIVDGNTFEVAWSAYAP